MSHPPWFTDCTTVAALSGGNVSGPVKAVPPAAFCKHSSGMKIEMSVGIAR